MKWLKESFTPLGVIVIMLLSGLALAGWFALMVHGSMVDRVAVRAITAAQHLTCLKMKRGNQSMEQERKECFNVLYRSGPYRVSHEVMGSN
jgi:hypothetical protein